MHIRQLPPGQTSPSEKIILKPAGQLHCFKRSGWVHILKTRLGGASKMRVMESPSSSDCVKELFCSVIFFSLPIQVNNREANELCLKEREYARADFLQVP